MTHNIRMDTFSSLFELRVRGMLARAFSVRGTEPTERQWEMLNGTRTITMHDLGEIGYYLDFEFELAMRPIDEGEQT